MKKGDILATFYEFHTEASCHSSSNLYSVPKNTNQKQLKCLKITFKKKSKQKQNQFKRKPNPKFNTHTQKHLKKTKTSKCKTPSILTTMAYHTV